MPITGADLLKEAQGSAPAGPGAALVGETDQPPQEFMSEKTRRMAESGIMSAEDVTNQLVAEAPTGVGALVRAFSQEFLEPAMRLAPQSMTGLAEQATIPQKATDAAQLTFNTLPGGRAVKSAAGLITAQATLETITGNPNTARTLAIVGQGVEGLYKMAGLVRGARATKQGARTILAGGEVPGGTATPMREMTHELIGREVKEIARAGLGTRKAASRAAVASAESAIVSAVPSIAPDHAARAGLMKLMADFATSGATVRDPMARKAMESIRYSVTNNLPINTQDLINVRLGLSGKAGYSIDPLNTTMPSATHAVREFRSGLASTLEAISPAPVGDAYRAAREAYRINYIVPRDALKGLTNVNVKSADAFKRVFNPNNQQMLRDTVRYANNNPALRGRLRQGFIETLADETGELRNPGQAKAAFDNMAPAMTASGLYTTEELMLLRRYIDAESLPKLKDQIGAALGGRLQGDQAASAAVGMAMMFKPMQMLGLLAATGTIREARRLTLLSPNSAGASKLAHLIAGKIDDYAASLRTLSASPNQDDPADD